MDRKRKKAGSERLSPSEKSEPLAEANLTRRRLLRLTAYAAPAVLTLAMSESGSSCIPPPGSPSPRPD